MYQTNIISHNEDDFKQLKEIFKETVCKVKFKEFNEEFNLNSSFITNWSCIWNLPQNQGRKCKIIQKDSEIAIVLFADETTIELQENILRHIYRLEDLTEC